MVETKTARYLHDIELHITEKLINFADVKPSTPSHGQEGDW